MWEVCIRKGERGIAQDFERQTQAFGHFALIIGGLCAQAEQFRLKRGELLVMVAKGAGLWFAATRSRDQVPSLRQWRSRHPGHGVAIYIVTTAGLARITATSAASIMDESPMTLFCIKPRLRRQR